MDSSSNQNKKVIFYAQRPEASAKLLDVLNKGLGKLNVEFSYQAFSQMNGESCNLAILLLPQEGDLENFKEILKKIQSETQRTLAIVDAKRKAIFEDQIKSTNVTQAIYFPVNSGSLLKTISSLLTPDIFNRNNLPYDLIRNIERNAIDLIPASMAHSHVCIPIKILDNHLHVAVTDPGDVRLLDLLRDRSSYLIKAHGVDSSTISKAIEIFYPLPGDDSASISKQSQSSNISFKAPPTPQAQETEGIAGMFNSIVAQAIKEKASDIHFEIQTTGLSLKYRVEGELRKIIAPPSSTHRSLVEHIKTLASLNLMEKNLPQEGAFQLRILNMDLHLRVSCVPTIQFEKIVVTIIKKEEFKLDINHLGFSSESLSLIRKYLSSPYGLVIVASPIRSGKSTTLYSMVQEIISEAKNIVSVENVIEFQLPGMTQFKLDPDKGFTAKIAMEHISYQDPDVVLIDPIRDHDTADSAIKFSLTGHQILAGISASGILHSFSQLRDLNVSSLTLGSALTMIIFQRLVKKICPYCKETHSISEELLPQLPKELQDNPLCFIGKGCARCNQTGYLGQTGVFEVLPIGKNLRQLLYQNRPLEEFQEVLDNSQWRDVKSMAFDLVQNGVTTIEQAISLHG